jgi:2-polyprenyl-3-methyl-5-hydroxy-6-metoxy-1,4-benzoquinol methylase
MSAPADAYRDKPAAYFGNVRREIEPLLPARAERVLEIGCGAGATLAWLRASGRAGHVTGVELSPEAAALARGQVDVLHEGDADRLIDHGLPAEGYDLVLCLDVLEHLVDPWATVRRLQRVIRPGGRLIASLPNVRHASVVLPLLLRGEFRYAESGLLDRTHLRFFTRDSALALIGQPGLRVERWQRRLHPWPSRSGWLNLLTAGLLRDLLALNYLIAAVRD